MATDQKLKSAAHRQTRYEPPTPLPGLEVLPIPPLTDDLAQAKQDLVESGMCFLKDALPADEVQLLRDKLDRQAHAERNLGELTPSSAKGNRQGVPNMINKGQVWIDLIEHELTDEIASVLLGNKFILSGINGVVYHGPVDEPQQLHRDQGQVPASVDFPASINMFWMLDEFRPEGGSTAVIPGSHRWPAEYQVSPPSSDLTKQISAPAGTLFAWDGRVWHGAGVNKAGDPRRTIITHYMLPWLRQQENWGISCLQEVIDQASDKLKIRLGMRTYGTYGMVSGTATNEQRGGFGSWDVVLPEYIIGEEGELHKLQRVSRNS